MSSSISLLAVCHFQSHLRPGPGVTKTGEHKWKRAKSSAPPRAGKIFLMPAGAMSHGNRKPVSWRNSTTDRLNEITGDFFGSQTFPLLCN